MGYEPQALRAVVQNIGTLYTMAGSDRDLGKIEGAAVAINRVGYIAWIGPVAELPQEYHPSPANSTVQYFDARGKMGIPGLVDPHTHLLYDDGCFDRLSAASGVGGYQARGIDRTIELTRAASEQKLLEQLRLRLEGRTNLGFTTVEVKTGYGLSNTHEKRHLELLLQLEGREEPCRPHICPTLLPCHFVPTEYEGRRDDYVDMVCTEVITRLPLEGWLLDIFVDPLKRAFTANHARQVARAMRNHTGQLRLHIHGDQTGDAGAAEVAAELGALSASHLNWTSPEGWSAMARANVVAVLTAYTDLHTSLQKLPNVRPFLDQGGQVALATNENPGSAPYFNDPWFSMYLGMKLYGLSLEQTLRAMTSEAAAAIGLDHKRGGVGRLEVGRKGDLVIADVPDPNVLVSAWNIVPERINMVIRGGEIIYQKWSS